MRKILIVVLVLVMVLSLTACGRGSSSSTTTNNGGTTTGSGMGSTGSGVGGSVGNAIGNAIDDVMDNAMDMTDLPFDKGASFMLGGKLYMLTGEVLRTDELDTQVLSITDRVTGVPSNEGEAYGFDKDTKIFRIKNNQTNDAVAVEIEGVYYRATLHEEDSNSNAGASSASTTKASSGSTSANGARGR